ncbi:hypothetical protein ABIB25_000543 [Nakamurella sp. UYEF19]|uniref:hypothetical protein n=1 Tax=Nakamurella sp. UYEF19 TaxID=1756392 RepID=UPI003399EC66
MTQPAPAEDSPGAGETDVKRTADRLRSFASSHGGSGTAVLSPMGRRGVRIVVVSADGPFADAVVPDLDVAAAVCERAGIPVGDWDRELSGRISVSTADRIRMAGTGR